MIIKNILPTTTVETILQALDPFAYLDERNVRLVKGKSPGSKCFCFVDMDSHEVYYSFIQYYDSDYNIIFQKGQQCWLVHYKLYHSFLYTACDTIGGAAHQTPPYHDWWSQSLCWGCKAFKKPEVSLIFARIYESDERIFCF